MRTERLACILILVASISQFTLGGQVSATGERSGMGIPVSTVVLLVAGAAVVLSKRRNLLFPELSWPHVIFLCLLCFGLLGLSRSDITDAVKELIKIGEIFILSWYVFWIMDDDTMPVLIDVCAILCVVLTLAGVGRIYAGGLLGLSDAKYVALIIITCPFLILRLAPVSPIVRWPVLCLVCVGVGLSARNGGLVLVFLGTMVWALLATRRTWKTEAACLIVLVLACVAMPPPGHHTAFNSLHPTFNGTHIKRMFIEYRASLLASGRYPFGGGLGNYKRTINVLRQYQPWEPHPREERVPRDSNSQYLLLMVEAGLPAACAMLVLFGASLLALRRHGAEVFGAIEGLQRSLTVSMAGLIGSGMFCVIVSGGTGIWVGALLGLSSRCAVAPANRMQGWTRLGLPGGAAVLCLLVVLTVNARQDPLEHVSRTNRFMASLFTPRPQTGLRPPVDDARLSNVEASPPNTTTEVAQRRATADGLNIMMLDGEDAQVDGVVRIEGESYDHATGHFQKIKANDASGNCALEIPEGSGKAFGEASYRFRVTQAGRHALVARVYWQDGCANSLGFTINGEEAMVTSDLYKQWHELKCKRTFDLPTGELTLLVRNLEDGIRLDYIELQRL